MIKVQKDRDYSPWFTFRVFLFFTLWLLYGLVPHLLPLWTLNFVTLFMIIYTVHLYSQRRFMIFTLFILAIILNTTLLFYISAKFNLFLTILIAIILLFDLVNTKK